MWSLKNKQINDATLEVIDDKIILGEMHRVSTHGIAYIYIMEMLMVSCYTLGVCLVA
jgi:hypothetical protein